MERMMFLVFHCPGSFLSEAHPGERKTLRVQAQKSVHFSMVWLSRIVRSMDDGRILAHYRKGKLQKNFIPPSKWGGRFQSVGAADAAMVVVIPNRLLLSKRVWSLRIPP